MANDPAFLFYPGDYLRDTQCLSEKAQVAYDRIMCEHMRNICISQDQLNFFTKRLTEDEKQELSMVLTRSDSGYQISWVAESICKRKDYSKSRSENRKGKKHNTSLSYDSHMENEIVNENKGKKEESIGGMGEKREGGKGVGPEMVRVFKNAFPDYPVDQALDFGACLEIAYKIAASKNWTKESVVNGKQSEVLESWSKIVSFVKSDKWYSTRSISAINKQFQDLIQAIKNGTTHKRGAQSTTAGGQDPTRIGREGIGKL